MVLEVEASNPHNNDEHEPGFVEDTGDTMTGPLTIGSLTIGNEANTIINSAGHLYIKKAGATLFSLGPGPNTDKVTINDNRVLFPVKAATVAAPTHVEGGLFFDSTLHYLKVGGNADWEIVQTSVMKNAANGIAGLNASSQIAPAQMAPYLKRTSALCKLTNSSNTAKAMNLTNYTYQITPADGDRMFMEFFCDGTETHLHLGTVQNVNRAIFDLYINGVLDSSGYDDYAGALTNITRDITLSESTVLGYNLIELRVNSKHASSSSYLIGLYNGILQ